MTDNNEKSIRFYFPAEEPASTKHDTEPSIRFYFDNEDLPIITKRNNDTMEITEGKIFYWHGSPKESLLKRYLRRLKGILKLSFNLNK